MQTLTINGIAQLVRAGRAHGLNPEQVLNDSGISLSMLEDPKSTIRPDQEFRVIHNLLGMMGAPHLGLIIGQQYPLSVLGVLGVAVPFAEDVRSAILFFLRYIRLSYTYFSVRFEEQTSSAHLVLEEARDLGDLRRYFVDRDLAFVMTIFRDQFPFLNEFHPLKVKLGYPAPADTLCYRNFFGCEVEFLPGASRLEMPIELLSIKLPNANMLTLKLLEESCAEISQRLGSQRGIAEQVRQTLRKQVRCPPSMECLSEQFACSARTLRRQLKLEGAQYQQLLNEVRNQEAKKLLMETPWSIEKIAEALGYSESASFIHAFQGWNGLSPKRFRRQVDPQGESDR